MKKQVKSLILAGCIVCGGTFMTSCGGSQQKEHEHQQEEVHDHGKMEQEKKAGKEQAELTGYICPMQCEGEKTYEETGKCPECGMDLKPVDEVIKEE